MGWWIELRCDAHIMTEWDKPSCWDESGPANVSGLTSANQCRSAAVLSYLKKEAKDKGWKFRKGESICPVCCEYQKGKIE